MKYSFGHIVIGAPQVLIGEYVSYVSKETAEYMLGKDNSPESRKRLNNLIFDQIEKKVPSKISILSGKNDWQYEKHLVPFIKEYEKYNADLEIVLDDRIMEHGDIAKYYDKFLRRKIVKILYDVTIIDSTFHIENEDIVFDTKLVNQSKCDIAQSYSIALNNEVVKTSDKTSVHVEEPGDYSLFLDIVCDDTDPLIW